MSFIFILFFGHLIGSAGALLISISNIVLALLCSIISFYKLSFDSILIINLWDWLRVSEFSVLFSLRYDTLTAVMFIVVSLVSSIVHIYSSVYMYTDPYLTKFMSYLSLFTFFMLLLVSANNLLVLFMGWEGVGLCSYLLIGFWHTRIQAAKSATKAFLINKIGDLFLLSGISFIFIIFNSLDFSTINSLVLYIPFDLVELIAIFLFVGAVGKSAQIGLHTWLPDAMEGPTPVSALIHAATMVTAGVFLVIRCSPILEYAPRMLYVIAVWGGITALISGTIGSVQNDIKKVIAYSTCSQLGFMFLACGLSLYNVGFFHLFNHAFFKALLFLSAGSIIHLLSNEQDIRKMGGIATLSPFIYINVLVASLSLAGFPFLSGFYSKDLIIEGSNTKYWVSCQFLYWLSTISAMLTTFYSFRLIYFTFIDTFNGFKNFIKNHSKVTIVEIILLGTLGILSLVSGYLFKDVFVGFGSNYFNNSILILPTYWSFIDLEFIPVFIKLFPVITSLLSLFIFYKVKSYKKMFIINSSVYFELSKWFYNELVNFYLVIPLFFYSRHSFEQIEKRILEFNGPQFFINVISNSIQFKYFNSARVNYYEFGDKSHKNNI